MLLFTFAIFSDFVNRCKPIRSLHFYMIAMEKKTYGSVQALLFPRNPGGAACRLCVSTILNSYSKHA